MPMFMLSTPMVAPAGRPSDRDVRLPRVVVWLAAIAAAAFSANACERVPLVAPSGTGITMVTSSSVLAVNGSTDITAFLIQGAQSGGQGGVTVGGGVPVHNGTTVLFTTTLGRIEPAEAKTEGGKVVVKLIADGRSGTATVTAISGPAFNTVDVTIGAAGATRVLVSATPQSLPPTGGTSTITAQVQDAGGNALLGVPVSFSTTAGTLSAPTAITDAQGVATTVLTTTAAATVTANAGGGTGALTGNVAITLRPQTTVTLTTPTAITASVPATFTVGVGANTIITNATIDFGDGTSTPLGSISANQTVQHLYGNGGSFTVKVAATDSNGDRREISAPVVVAPLVAVLTASPPTVAFGGSINFTVATSTGALIERYEWDFGDGPVIVTPANTMSHIFQRRGTHTVVVRVVPLVGPSKLVTVQIEIT